MGDVPPPHIRIWPSYVYIHIFCIHSYKFIVNVLWLWIQYFRFFLLLDISLEMIAVRWLFISFFFVLHYIYVYYYCFFPIRILFFWLNKYMCSLKQSNCLVMIFRIHICEFHFISLLDVRFQFFSFLHLFICVPLFLRIVYIRRCVCVYYVLFESWNIQNKMVILDSAQLFYAHNSIYMVHEFETGFVM